MKPPQRARQSGRAAKPNNPRTVPATGLILDDYLNVMEEMRRRCSLPEPTFGLHAVQSYPRAEEAIQRIVSDTVRTWGAEIYTLRHPLLERLDEAIYDGSTTEPGLPRQHIHPDWINPVLRRVLEVGLQTIVQSPSRDAKSGSSRKRTQSLSAALRKSGQEVHALLATEEFRERVRFTGRDAHTSWTRLQQLGEDMEWGAALLDEAAVLQLRRIDSDISNPQVRLALYVSEWFKVCTGRKHYQILQILLTGAFYAADRNAPVWVERLQVEAHLRQQKWVRWLKSVSQ
jgi:hypothetical protein